MIQYKCILCDNGFISRDNVKEVSKIPNKMARWQIHDDADDPYGFGTWDFIVYLPSMRKEGFEAIRASEVLRSYKKEVIVYKSKESAIEASKILFNFGG